MFIGVGAGDAGINLELNHKRYYFSHEMIVFQNEQYTSDGIGAELVKKLDRYTSFVGRAKVNYEHHYRSELYARSYATLVPELGIRSNHDYVGIQFMLQPFKYFVRLTNQDSYPIQGMRVQPTISLSIRFDLNYTLYVPRQLTIQQKGKKK